MPNLAGSNLVSPAAPAEAAAGDRNEAPLEALIRRLLDAEAGPDGAADGVVVNVDGVAYELVLRLREATAGASLSPREQEIVRLVAKGLPNKAIAEILDLSLWTVGTHLRRVFAKLGVNTRAEMVAHALSHHLIDVRD